MRRDLGVFLLLALLLSTGVLRQPGALAAQEETPEPGPEASRYLPAADSFGKGWSGVQRTGVDVSAETFREGAIGFYGGPNGARAVVMVLLVTDSRVAIRTSWEEASEIYDNYRYRLNYDYEREEELGSLPPPPDCAEAKRIDGTDPAFGFQTGIVLYGADPDVVLLVVLSGELGDRTGYEAAEAVVGLSFMAAA